MKRYAKVSLLCTLVASVCTIIGIATPDWLSKAWYYEGLWDYCSYQSGGIKTCFKLDHRADFEWWIQAVRVLVIFSAVTALANVIVLMLYIKRNDGRTDFTRIRFAICLCILSAASCLTGVVWYAVQKNNGYFSTGYHFAWSFILTTIGGTIMALVLVPLLVELRQSRMLGLYESI